GGFFDHVDAGLTSARVAGDGGASVGIIEKASHLGGTTAAGGVAMWACTRHRRGRRSYAAPTSSAADYPPAVTKGKLSEEESHWYIENSSAAVRYLDENTRVDYAPLARPDYHGALPGATEGGRGLDHKPFDPSVVPGLREAVRQPTYLPLIS